jgi:hypothetical protein
MCNPVLIQVGLMALGTGASVIGQQQQAGFQADVAKNNQIIQQRMAEDALNRGKRDEMTHRMRVAQIKSRQRAAFGASGVDPLSGSASDILADTAMMGELDALTIRSNAEREAYAHLTGAQNSGAQGRLSRLRGQSGAAGTLLSGGGKVAQAWYANSGA